MGEAGMQNPESGPSFSERQMEKNRQKRMSQAAAQQGDAQEVARTITGDAKDSSRQGEDAWKFDKAERETQAYRRAEDEQSSDWQEDPNSTWSNYLTLLKESVLGKEEGAWTQALLDDTTGSGQPTESNVASLDKARAAKQNMGDTDKGLEKSLAQAA